jgi:hypothetical protein
MTGKLFYVVSPQLNEIDEGLFDATGNKDISLYDVVNDNPVPIKTLVTEIEENSEEAICDYIEEIAPEMFDEVTGKPLYELTQL